MPGALQPRGTIMVISCLKAQSCYIMQSYSFIYLFLINVALLVLVLPTAQGELIQFLSHVVNTPWSVFEPLFLSQTWHLKGRRCRSAQLCRVMPAPDQHQAQALRVLPASSSFWWLCGVWWPQNTRLEVRLVNGYV